MINMRVTCCLQNLKNISNSQTFPSNGQTTFCHDKKKFQDCFDSADQKKKINHAIIGIGINVNQIAFQQLTPSSFKKI